MNSKRSFRCARVPSAIGQVSPPTLKGLVLAVLLMLAFGQAKAANQDGSIGGLKAKFVDVNGTRTRYYEAGRASRWS